MGAKVHVNQHGYLCLRIYWRGRAAWVGVKEPDDGPKGKSRTLLEAKARLITEALRKGRSLHLALLEVLGDCPPNLMPPREQYSDETATVGQAAERWYAGLEAQRRRKSLLSKTRNYLDGVILPFWGNTLLKDVSAGEVERFQTSVLARKRVRRDRDSGEIEEVAIRVKTARNIVGGHFRALIGWCRRIYRLPKDNPFDGLQWARERPPEPDPLTAEERASILAHFEGSKPFWFAWVNTLLWTGMRQGETTALRLSDFDAEGGTIRINKSRSEGEENDPKTERSIRTIRLLAEALGPLRSYTRGRLILDPDAYLFVNPEGRPINHKEWPKKSFYPVLRKLQIRMRDFYSTRDTFISEMLRRGEPVKAIAEYCGTSAAMIERSYGRYFPKDLDGGVKTLGGTRHAPSGGAKTVTSTVTSVARAVGDGLTTASDQRKQKWSHGESNLTRGIRSFG